MSLPQNLLAITQADVQQLVDEQADEGAHLDFKRDFPPAWDNAAKHEFLADVTAFSNSGGGDLVFGIDEDGNAHASAIVPQAIANTDNEIRRLQDFLLNLTEPRVPGVVIHALQVDVAGVVGYVLVVRVPQSWGGPHRVRTNQHFYIRDGKRKRQLDVTELRSLILRTESQSERVTNFRTERLGKILSGEAPHPLVNGPVLVAHLVPTQAALGLVHVDPTQYVGLRGLPVIGTNAGLARVNLDGALSVRNQTPQGETHGYSLLFRNGFFEATYVLSNWVNGRAVLASVRYEQHLIALLENFRREMAHLAINSECAVMLSLLRANEVKLGVRGNQDDDDGRLSLFDRRTVVLPDAIARPEVEAVQAMKPVFDLLWQAAGYARSQNYDAQGNWIAGWQ